MADSTIANLTTQTTIHDADLGVGVDTTDTTQSVQGTTKKWTWTTIVSYLTGKFNALYLGIGANATTATLATTAITATTTTGNSGTATKLSSPVYINGVSFDGSANIVNSLSEGTMINGKISVAVASNNITLTLLGSNGSNPSATNIVYAMIGGTMRSITAALSETVNAGANTFNSGGAELATKEIDYFAYLGYNATDGVTLGFSRIPYATSYGDFSATATNEKFCAISTITHAASTDYYNVIGRFAATLSAGAGYTWTVPTYTAINLIQRPIFETRTLSISPQFVGFSANPTIAFSYKIRGLVCEIYYGSVSVGGTSNAATLSETLPIGCNSLGSGVAFGADNSVPAFMAFQVSGSKISFGKNGSEPGVDGQGFTTSGTKYSKINTFYTIA